MTYNNMIKINHKILHKNDLTAGGHRELKIKQFYRGNCQNVNYLQNEEFILII
jgi:hypothetical protein